MNRKVLPRAEPVSGTGSGDGDLPATGDRPGSAGVTSTLAGMGFKAS